MIYESKAQKELTVTVKMTLPLSEFDFSVLFII